MKVPCAQLLAFPILLEARACCRESANRLWIELRWYPVIVLLYYGDIAALAANNFRSLTTLLLSPVGIRSSGTEAQPVLIPAVKGMLELTRAHAFKNRAGPTKRRCR
jgi:hypothetical protein